MSKAFSDAFSRGCNVIRAYLWAFPLQVEPSVTCTNLLNGPGVLGAAGKWSEGRS